MKTPELLVTTVPAPDEQALEAWLAQWCLAILEVEGVSTSSHPTAPPSPVEAA